MDPSGVLVAPPRRLHSSKPPAPPPPQKVRKYDSSGVEVEDEDAPPTFGISNPKKEQDNEPQGLVFGKLGDDVSLERDQQGEVPEKVVGDQKLLLTNSGETLLAKFYGMLYTNDSAEKEWKLEVDGFIPVCFVQVHGNPDKPFKIIACENSRRVMEYLVRGNTTCARNSTFVKWQDGSSMFGVRLAKDDQAEQFFSTVKRMASTLAKAAQLMKQQHEREMSDPTSSSNIHHTKVSLMIKLPDKQTTIMSVPGLLTMRELFEMICEKENLNTMEHQLSLPRTGAKKVTFDSGTAVGLLNIREVAILRTAFTDNRRGSSELQFDSVEDLLDVTGEENKILEIVLPMGTKKSYRVSLGMTMKQLVTRICSREKLKPRHHSLQYIDFKHEFLSMASTVDELEVNQIRLMDKRGCNITRSSITDDESPSNGSYNMKFRKNSGVESESDSSSTISGEDKENIFHWQRSKSLDALTDNAGVDVFTEEDEPAAPNQNIPDQPTVNGTAPASLQRNSSGGFASKKPPALPKPYAAKSSTLPKKPPVQLPDRALKDQSFSPIKKDGITYASTPDLSFSSKSEISPGTSNIKTSTPDSKIKRRAAPPPPARPAVPKALFAEGKTDCQAVGSGVAAKKSSPAARANPLQGQPAITAPTARCSTLQAAPANDAQLKPSQKRRPAPPRPSRPAPPKPVRQTSTESRDSKGSDESNDRTREMLASSKQRSLSLDLGILPGDYQQEGDGNVDRRGVPPIFIPPPPPDDMPPPLDECETPVGPLTDFEADILEGSANDNSPAPVNGFVDFDKYLVPSPRQSPEKGEMETEPSDRMSVLATVHHHSLFPVVPPPPLYSEPLDFSSHEIIPQRGVVSNKKEPQEDDKPRMADVPTPLDTETTTTSQDSQEKDHDSGFEHSIEGLKITPPVGPSQNASSQSWEDPDSGSCLDGISAIPPPLDFATTRPITPPCQFANPTLVPPEGFLEEQEPERIEPRKKLNVSEALFPWMKEAQAPLNATVPLASPENTNKDPEREMINSKDKIHLDENITQGYSEEKTNIKPGTGGLFGSRSGGEEDESKNQRNEIQSRQEEMVQGSTEFAKETVKANVAVNESAGLGFSRGLSSDKKEGPVAVTNSNSLQDTENVNQGMVARGVSKEKEQLQIAPKRVKPEPKAKPAKLARDAKVEIEPMSGVQQFVSSSIHAFTEVTRPEQEADAFKTEGQLKSEITEMPPRPFEAHSPSFSEPQDTKTQEPDGEPMMLEKKLEKPEIQVKPMKVVKGPSVDTATSKVSVGVVKPDEKEMPGKPISIIGTITLVREAEIQVKAHEASSGTASPEVIKPKQQVVLVKPAPHGKAKADQPETTTQPDMLVKETVHSYTEATKREQEFKPVIPVLQAKPEKQPPSAVEEVVTAQLKPEVQLCLPQLQYAQPEYSRDKQKSEHEAIQDAAMAIVNVGEDNVALEPLVTAEIKPTRSSHDNIKYLEGMLQELDKEGLPSANQTRDISKPPKPYEELLGQSISSEEVIVAETKPVEWSSYNQFQEALELNSERGSVKGNLGGANKDEKTVPAEGQQGFDPERSTSRTDIDSELRLDLSSLQQCSLQPRPPSSSPTVSTPRSSSLPSPTELHSDRSTESGISLSEESKIPCDSLGPSRDKETTAVQSCSTQTELQGDSSVNGTSADDELQTRTKSVKVSSKLQRPWSMPSGVPGDYKSVKVSETKQAATDSSLPESTGVLSSSLPSSPVETGGIVEPVELAKPPRFTVPPLRRYTDLPSDLSFISSAAKAAERVQEPEKKPEAPSKPADFMVKRSAVSVVDRPRSWMGPGFNNDKRSVMWSSAFKPVTLDVQDKKVARPVAFNVKSFAGPSVDASVPPATNATGAGLSEGAYTIERRSLLNESSKNIPMVQEKPPEKARIPVVSPEGTDPNNNPVLKKAEPCTSEHENSSNSSESQRVSNDNQIKADKTVLGSRGSSKDVSSSVSIRDHIMRDSIGGNRAPQARPQSVIVGGSKYQVLTAGPHPSISTGGSWADVKKRAAIQASGVKAEVTSRKHIKRQEDEPSEPDLPYSAAKQPQTIFKVTNSNTQPGNTPSISVPPVKEVNMKLQPVQPTETRSTPFMPVSNKLPLFKATADKPLQEKATDSLPTVKMRTKTGKQDPAKRHSMPAYIIEGADGKQPHKTSGPGRQFHFIMKEVKTDTNVVPQGVVAAMKALRERKETSAGN